MRPPDLKYTETHEWIKISGKNATIGITDYAISQLSDLVHMELPKVGDTMEQGNPFGEIESIKTVADLIAPISGKIIEVNKEVVDNLDTIVEDPFEEGWLIKIKMSDTKELDSLMSAKEYQTFIETTEAAEKGKESEDIDEDDFV